MSALLEITDLHTEIRLSRSVVHALDGVSLSVAPGECLGIVGESGCGKTMTALSVMRLLRRVTRANVALVGDASGSVDAITGHGLALAFRQAKVLAEALETWKPAVYEAAHRELIFKQWVWARALLGLSRSDALRSLVMRALSWKPRLYARLLSTHTAG